MTRDSDFEIGRQETMSQLLSANDSDFQRLAGTDQKISDKIVTLEYLTNPENLKKSPRDFFLGYLDLIRKSHFATNERLSDVTRLGFFLPRKPKVYSD